MVPSVAKANGTLTASIASKSAADLCRRSQCGLSWQRKKKQDQESRKYPIHRIPAAAKPMFKAVFKEGGELLDIFSVIAGRSRQRLGAGNTDHPPKLHEMAVAWETTTS
jgi:hypothetical protein